MAGLVLAVLVPSVRSVAVIVKLPAVLRVIWGLSVPAINAVLAGRVALASVDVTPTVCVTVGTRFQLASTALTVRLNGVVAIWALGVPVLPVAVPGAALSPGTSSCSFTNVPGLTVTLPLVPEVNPVALA